MPYDNIVSRSDSAALVPEQVSSAMLEGLASQSAALTQFRQISVPTKMTRFPVISALPLANWVDGDTGLKQTTEVGWSNKSLTVEKLAAIVPVPKDVADDLQDGAGFDLWAEVLPLVQQAIGRKIDQALFLGIDKPVSQPTDLAASAIAAGNVVARGTANAAAGGIAEDFNQLFGKVEADGFGVNTVITDLTYRTRLRSARATDGQKLLDISTGSLDGVDVTYAMDGLWPSGASAVEAFAGDKNKVIIGLRKDFYWDIWDQAVIQNAEGEIVYNLAQQNMFALVVEMRVGWQYSNPINYRQQTESVRFPFAVLRSPAS